MTTATRQPARPLPCEDTIDPTGLSHWRCEPDDGPDTTIKLLYRDWTPQGWEWILLGRYRSWQSHVTSGLLPEYRDTQMEGIRWAREQRASLYTFMGPH